MKASKKVLAALTMMSALSGSPLARANTEFEPVEDEPNMESAVRGENESFEEALARTGPSMHLDDEVKAVRRATPLERAKAYSSSLDVSALPEWTARASDLEAAFANARDQRIYVQKKRPNFKRRSSWLYPDDGCYARATHIANSFRRRGYKAPGKLFAFGNLKLRTSYNLKGRVYWWYHTAAAYRYGTRVVVLDPAVDMTGPIELSDWLAEFSASPASVKVSACDPFAYSPRTSICVGGASSQERWASTHQLSFLTREWNRLLNLRLDPKKLLGDHPPWLRSFVDPSVDEGSRAL